MMPRVAALILAAVLALVSGGGVYLWQNGKVKPLQQELQGLSDKLQTTDTKLQTAESNLRRAEEELKSAVQTQNDLSRKVSRLEEAVRIDTAEKDVADAYGRARVSRNDDWILALMIPELRSAYTPFPTTSNPKPNRYEIVSGQGNTWVVRVWEHVAGEGEIGYSDATLTISKRSDGYFWITGHKVGQFVNQRGSAK